MSYEYAFDWQYGYREIVAEVKKLEPKYEKVIISPKLDQPHMFFLFYLKYDPQKYLAEGGTKSSGFKDLEHKFGKYEFRFFDFAKESEKQRYLFIGTPDEIPIGQKTIKTIYYPNGDTAANLGAG